MSIGKYQEKIEFLMKWVFARIIQYTKSNYLFKAKTKI